MKAPLKPGRETSRDRSAREERARTRGWRRFEVLLITGAFLLSFCLADYLAGRQFLLKTARQFHAVVMDSLHPGPPYERPAVVTPRTRPGPSAAREVSDEWSPPVHGVTFRCSDYAPRGIATKPGALAYKWEDRGVVNFGDEPPPGVSVEPVILGAPRKDLFSVVLDLDPGVLAPDLHAQVQRYGEMIYASLAQYLDWTRLDKSVVRARVLRSQVAYQQLRAARYPHVSARASGFFSGRENRIFTYAQRTPGQLYRVMVHELSHLVAARNLGAHPRWLAEGLAMVHEQRALRTGGIRGAGSFWWPETARNEMHDGALKALLAANEEAWKGPASRALYARSFAVVSFLMTEHNTRVMQRMLKTISRDRCDEEGGGHLLDDTYPGGTTRFEQDLLKWLRAGGLPLHVARN